MGWLPPLQFTIAFEGFLARVERLGAQRVDKDGDHQVGCDDD